MNHYKLNILTMKKILIAFDGIHFSKSAFEFAKKLNEVSPVLLTGVFLPQIIFNTSFGGYVLPRIHELIIVWFLAFVVDLTVMLIFKSNRHFLIPYFYFLIIYFFCHEERLEGTK
jgi:hypothetical protein